MTRPLIFLLILCCFVNVSMSQPKKGFLKKIKKDQNCILFAKEQDEGLLMNWSLFKEGKIQAMGDQKGETIMLLGSATYLYEFLRENYTDFKVEIPKPTSSFHIIFHFDGSTINLYRKFNNSAMWSDNYAFERPENYWLTYSFDSNDDNINNAAQVLLTYYNDSFIEYTKDCMPEIHYEDQPSELLGPATLYVYDVGENYNNSLQGAYNLNLNDSTICKVIKGNPQIINNIKPGKYNLNAKSTELQVEFKSGKEYYIRCGTFETTPLINKPKIHVVVPQFGKKEFTEQLKNSN